jgi:ribA/ribD-fused uncharacterized protein
VDVVPRERPQASVIYVFKVFPIPVGAVPIRGRMDPASNFWAERFVFRGRPYCSGEQCYQFHKAIATSDWKNADRVLWNTDSQRLKSIGNTIVTVHSNWDNVKYNFMWEMLTAKATQSEAFLVRLRKTGQAPLYHTVENEFWGSGKSGAGQNLFGCLLEQIRAMWC